MGIDKEKDETKNKGGMNLQWLKEFIVIIRRILIYQG